MATAKISSAEFEEFWERYPRKIAKLAAQKAYEKARRAGVSQQELIAGVERYMTHKPAYADYAHASSWLNAGRWMDAYDAPKPPQRVPTTTPDDMAEYERMREAALKRQGLR